MRSPSEIVASGTLRNGKVTIRDRGVFEDGLATMPDGEVFVRVERPRATRSLKQNAFYWGVLIQGLSEHTGYTPDEMHEFLKMKFIPKRLAVAKGNGEIVDELVIGGTTTKLDTIDFTDYCAEIQRWAAEELDLVLEDPLAR